jgi:hypothetical protein
MTQRDPMISTYIVADATITSGMYRNGAVQTWEIRPATNYSGITVTFTFFDIECDHDLLRVFYVRTNISKWRPWSCCVAPGASRVYAML